eukprot:m.142745 g.142745  ORF g.142745 m.142745 type:complete len:179 (+) comp14080_c0_seq5:65-601(+)
MAAQIDMSLEDRMKWKFEYSDISPMIYSCCCTTCGVRKPSDAEGGLISINQICTCICLKSAGNCAVDLHYTCCHINTDIHYLAVKYDQGKHGKSPGQCTDSCLCAEAALAGQVCCCFNCGGGYACGKPEIALENQCNLLCLSSVCMLPPGGPRHNNPFTLGCLTKWFKGAPGGKVGAS